MAEQKAPQDDEDTHESGHFRTGEPITMTAASTRATHPASSGGEGLKVVTISPATDAQPVRSAPTPSGQGKSPDPYLGCLIDERYKVEAMLGEGGMGVVYRCSHKIIGKKVAMKVLRADMARDAEVTERFLNEAKAASSIGNSHIIDISDFGQLPDGSTYFVMEFLEGVPLSEAIEKSQSLTIARIIDIAEQLAEGLAAAHHAQIVHRDLKPDNIYLIKRGQNSDFVKILDFGIAKVSTTEGKLTRAGAVFGTPHYMSPEQAAGAPVDHRGDIYSMGVILYELASGRVPFDADNFMGILTQHMYKAPVPIRALVPEPPDVPPGLEAIILKCLSKRPEQRYESMDELGKDLQRLKDGQIPEAVQDMMNRSAGFSVPQDYFRNAGAMPAPLPASPTPRRRARWPLFAGLAGVAVAALVVVGLRAGSPEPEVVKEPPKTESAKTTEATETPPAEVPETEDLGVIRQVVLAVEPLDAQVFAGDHDLGKSPVFVDVKEGATVSVEIKREGYETKTLDLDGSEGRLSLKLDKTKPVGEKAPRKAPSGAPKPKAPAQSPQKKKKPTLGGGEIINPWG